MVAQVSEGEIKENRNLMWTKREKDRLLSMFSTNTNYENMAYPSLRSEKCSTTGVSSTLCLLIADLCGRHCQMGSLAGAAHVLNDKAGVRR